MPFANEEERRLYNRMYYYKNRNKLMPKIREYWEKYYKEHREKERARSKKKYQENKNYIDRLAELIMKIIEKRF